MATHSVKDYRVNKSLPAPQQQQDNKKNLCATGKLLETHCEQPSEHAMH